MSVVASVGAVKFGENGVLDVCISDGSVIIRSTNKENQTISSLSRERALRLAAIILDACTRIDQ